MEEDNGLELSLGLSCRRPSGERKGNNTGGSLDNQAEKVRDDFKTFLHPGTEKLEPSTESQRSDPVKPRENFFSDLSKAVVSDTDGSTERFLVEGERAEADGTRKLLFMEMNDRKKQDKKAKTSEIPVTAEEGSTAENDVVAESDINGGSVPVQGSNTTQPASSGNFPVLFGYSLVQLPMLDKDGSWGPVSCSQQFHPSYAGRGAPNTGAGKQQAAEEGSSNQTVDAKGSSINFGAKDALELPTGDKVLSLDFSVIKPGIAADVKFGGSGSRPKLPWVSTTGLGLHGRTISGVTYQYSADQIRIVCACHGSHMSPEEFVSHASEKYVSPEASVGLTAASAHR